MSLTHTVQHGVHMLSDNAADRYAPRWQDFREYGDSARVAWNRYRHHMRLLLAKARLSDKEQELLNLLMDVRIGRKLRGRNVLRHFEEMLGRVKAQKL